MATIQKRVSGKGTAYRVMIRLKGYPPESATFERLTDAREWASKTEAEIRAGRHFGASKRHTLGELVAKYTAHKQTKLKSWRDTERHLAMWLKLLGDCQLNEVTPARIGEQRNKLLNEQTKRGTQRHPATVTRMMAALSVCLGYGVKELQWLDRNPAEKVSKPGHSDARVRFLSDKERTTLLKACKASTNKDLYTAVVLALTTGARKAEIMGLRWPQVDFKRRTITLMQGETKNDEARALPLVGEAFTLLKERTKVRNLKDDRVFPTTSRAKKATMLDLRSPWEAALKAAKVTDFRWHDLRHTAASYLAMQGVSPLEISKILGHRTMAMVSRYSHLAPGRVVELGDALAARMGLA
ncbi:MAG: site-specific integrase [Pseudomonadota bacterium]